MKLSIKWARALVALIFISCLILGCSGNNPSAPGTQPADGEPIRLSLGEPSETIAPGAVVSLPVYINDAEGLYAFSFRVEFNPLGAEPVDVDWGEFRAGTDAVFCPLDKPGVLPIAYSKLDGSCFDGEGTVCVLKFKVLDPSSFHVRIIDEAEYLVAYTNTHERLDLTAGGEV